MLHLFKVGTKQLLLDTDRALLYTLDELEAGILKSLDEPLPENCPSSLRYSLAKYDSATVTRAYSTVLAISRGDTSTGKSIRFDNINTGSAALAEYSADAPELAKTVLALAATHDVIDAKPVGDGIPNDALAREYEKLARELYKRSHLGKPFVFVPFTLTREDIAAPSSLSDIERRRVECALFSQL